MGKKYNNTPLSMLYKLVFSNLTLLSIINKKDPLGTIFLKRTSTNFEIYNNIKNVYGTEYGPFGDGPA